MFEKPLGASGLGRLLMQPQEFRPGFFPVHHAAAPSAGNGTAHFRDTGALGAAIPVDQLTYRELDVLELLQRRLSNKEIARDLGIGEKTVKTHVSNILGKLQLGDRTQLAIYAIKKGLVNLDQ